LKDRKSKKGNRDKTIERQKEKKTEKERKRNKKPFRANGDETLATELGVDLNCH
jgi:hypothetical protein